MMETIMNGPKTIKPSPRKTQSSIKKSKKWQNSVEKFYSNFKVPFPKGFPNKDRECNAFQREMMYLPTVQANTQLKSESLQTKEDTIKGKLMKVGT